MPGRMLLHLATTACQAAPEFASVVHAHFRLRAATLREQLGRWVAEARVPPPGCGPPDSGHATRLEALRVALEGELAKIAC